MIIGIDSSGKIDQLPCFIVGVRDDFCYCIEITKINKAAIINEKHWKEKLTAAHMFKLIKKIYRKGDMIEIDDDFSGTKKEIIKYLDYLLRSYYQMEVLLRVSRDKWSKSVGRADKLSKFARNGKLAVDLKNPDVSNEWNTISKK
ncbi:MAG: hypothetical protein V1911_02040 [Candidatus Micrarchaeota archaeon]